MARRAAGGGGRGVGAAGAGVAPGAEVGVAEAGRVGAAAGVDARACVGAGGDASPCAVQTRQGEPARPLRPTTPGTGCLARDGAGRLMDLESTTNKLDSNFSKICSSMQYVLNRVIFFIYY